ncbi:MAG TPA: hypothetical protein VNA89_14335 [Gemmatimonadaceae bacterium]|nr:hypothetical protein [Gemmatimonadaceae bacterium]
MRRLLLALVLFTNVGLIVELALLEHTESATQWIPFAVLAAGLAASAAVALRPGPGTLRAFQSVMASFVVAGALGLYLHFRGNVEFELETDPAAHGLGLVWRALTGATPTLAPGAMTQLGLLGLTFAWRHPAFARGQAARDQQSEGK